MDSFIAGVTVDGKPKLLAKTFVNGEEEETVINPSLERWILSQVPVLVKSPNLASEVRLVAGCFDDIVRRIDGGTIKTSPNARSQLQMALTAALATASPTAVNDWTPLLEALSRQLEKEFSVKIDDLATVRQVLQRTAEALKAVEVPKAVVRRPRGLLRPLF